MLLLGCGLLLAALNSVGCAALGCPAFMGYGDYMGCYVPVGEVRSIPFGASAGDRVLIRVRDEGNASLPALTLLDPNNAVSECTSYPTDGTEVERECLLTTGGTFSLVLEVASPSTRPGYFGVFLARLNGTVVPAATTIAYGGVRAGSIEEMKWRPYEFSGSAGDRVLLRLRETAGSSIQGEMSINRADGSTRCVNASINPEGSIVCTLDATGSYSVWIRARVGNQTGSYDLYLDRLIPPRSAASLSYGSLVSGHVDPMHWVPLTFDAAAGEEVLVRIGVTSGDLAPRTSLWGPDGSSVCSSIQEVELDCVVRMDGNHTIWLRSNRGNESGDFNLYLARLSAPSTEQPTGINYGDIINANIEALRWYPYIFQGVAGEQILIRLLNTTGTIGPNVSLRRPDQTQLCAIGFSMSEFTRECTLDADGTYTIWLAAYGGDQAGTVSMYLARLSAPTTEMAKSLEHDDLEFGYLTSMRWVPYALGPTLGETITVGIYATAGTLNLRFSLRGPTPSSTEICAGYASVHIRVTCTLSPAESYTLWVYSAQAAFSGPFNIQYSSSSYPELSDDYYMHLIKPYAFSDDCGENGGFGSADPITMLTRMTPATGAGPNPQTHLLHHGLVDVDDHIISGWQEDTTMFYDNGTCVESEIMDDSTAPAAVCYEDGLGVCLQDRYHVRAHTNSVPDPRYAGFRITAMTPHYDHAVDGCPGCSCEDENHGLHIFNKHVIDEGIDPGGADSGFSRGRDWMVEQWDPDDEHLIVDVLFWDNKSPRLQCNGDSPRADGRVFVLGSCAEFPTLPCQ